MTFKLTVTEPDGREPDLNKIVKTEPWANHLRYYYYDLSSLSGFAVSEEGILLLTDACGNFVEVPPGRFDWRLSV